MSAVVGRTVYCSGRVQWYRAVVSLLLSAHFREDAAGWGQILVNKYYDDYLTAILRK